MRPTHLGFSLAFFVAAAAGGCTATGSTVVTEGKDGGSLFPIPSEETETGTGMDGGTTAKDAATRPATTADDYDALFGPPASTDTTPNVLNGLWAGTAGTVDSRLKFSSNSVLIARKCSANVVGLTVVAKVTSSSIKTLESKSISDAYCGSFDVRPLEIPRCISSSEGYAQNESYGLSDGCFFLSGTKLSFFQGSFVGDATFTKLSD
jgi:hypothetical protein